MKLFTKNHLNLMGVTYQKKVKALQSPIFAQDVIYAW